MAVQDQVIGRSLQGESLMKRQGNEKTGLRAMRRTLWLSGLTILLCASMLAGTSFAWFSDTLSSPGNRIEAGTFAISASIAQAKSEAGAAGPYAVCIDGRESRFDFDEFVPLQNASPLSWTGPAEPGWAGAVLLTVKNEGTLPVKIALALQNKVGELESALWYSLKPLSEVQAPADGQQCAVVQQNPVSQLKATETGSGVYLLTMDGTQPEDDPSVKLPAGETQQYILTFGMYSSAGQSSAGKAFATGFTVLVSQDPDGLGLS